MAPDLSRFGMCDSVWKIDGNMSYAVSDAVVDAMVEEVSKRHFEMQYLDGATLLVCRDGKATEAMRGIARTSLGADVAHVV